MEAERVVRENYKEMANNLPDLAAEHLRQWLNSYIDSVEDYARRLLTLIERLPNTDFVVYMDALNAVERRFSDVTCRYYEFLGRLAQLESALKTFKSE